LPRNNETALHGRLLARLLLVADGVGGNEGGDVASRIAVESAVEYLLDMKHGPLGCEVSREDQLLKELKAAVAWSQRRVQSAAEHNHRYSRMGTTLTLAYVIWPTVYLVHAGDSRAYLCRGSKLTQLTRDQSVAQLLADAGAIRADEVASHHFRHVLGSLLSWNPRDLHPVVYKTRLVEGDQLLLCTDGLTKHVSPARITAILNSAPSAKQACHGLVAAANAAGGTDNITVALARG
jgi:protein phosphatase